VTGVLMFLKKESELIKRFELKEERVLHNEQILIIDYTTHLTNSDNEIIISFRYFFDESKIKKPKVKSVDLKYIKVYFNNGKIVSNKDLEKAVDKNSFGLRSETVFYRSFLLPIQKRFPHKFKYIYHSGDRQDKKQGIDFVVGYVKDGNVFDVNFNLKSSGNYIEEHIKKYPKVGTFIFRERNLNNLGGLRNKFFNFLDSSVTNGVAHL
jgi:hypothetical protein